ncbi:MAG: mandelate racemase [Chloroflexota bacterium]|nr:mandelate racemase [Chloroflexota bacterium]
MDPVITRIDMALIEGKRPRAAGSNARLGYHGDSVRLPVMRLTTADGAVGFGRCATGEEHLRPLLGKPVSELVAGGRVRAGWTLYELPLLDLAARLAGQPVYAFAGGERPRVQSYDTSLYFDDLHLADDATAADLIAGEARDGWDRGHRAFKIKVGRGARHMPLEAGTVRDTAIIKAVREAVGPEATVVIDANNGWNLNLTKRVLSETADANLYWVEEAFHEDNVLYADLKEWLTTEGLAVRIADGEGSAHPSLADWAREGLVDVVQYNIFGYGFDRWRQLGSELDGLGAQSSPHTYGGGVSAYVTAHLAGVTGAVKFVEWDFAEVAEIDASAWTIRDGWIEVPDASGFGLELDHRAFDAAVARNGFTLRQ